MDKRLQQGLNWLDKEMKRDEVQIAKHKNKMIEEIKNLDRKEMFKVPEKKKISFFTKILMIFGHGKKG
jgi:hypothetical protein